MHDWLRALSYVFALLIDFLTPPYGSRRRNSGDTHEDSSSSDRPDVREPKSANRFDATTSIHALKRLQLTIIVKASQMHDRARMHLIPGLP